MRWEACAILQNSSPKEPQSFVLSQSVGATVAVARKENKRRSLLCVRSQAGAWERESSKCRWGRRLAVALSQNFYLP
jgi:hypothetical protein